MLRTALLVVTSLPILAPAQQASSGLEETLQWVQQTLVQHGNYVEYYQYKSLRSRHDFTRVKYDGCHLTVEIDSHGGALGDNRDSSSADLNLKDLDPSATTIEPSQRMKIAILVDGKGPYDEAFVKLFTHNSALTINRVYTLYWDPKEWKSRGEKQSTPENEKVADLEMAVDSPDYANRLAKALKHAAELCGAKASAF